jgi:hypothetical protein
MHLIRGVESSREEKGKRVPAHFIFKLAKNEFESLRHQMEAVENVNFLTSQIRTLKTGSGSIENFCPLPFKHFGICYSLIRFILL